MYNLEKLSFSYVYQSVKFLDSYSYRLGFLFSDYFIKKTVLQVCIAFSLL